MTGKKNKNRKVLFVTASTQGGGAERMLFNIISSLDCHIEKELVITSCDTPPQNRCIDYPTVSLRKKHALSSFGAIVRHINVFRPDYVFTTSSTIGYLLVLSKLFTSCAYKVIIRCAVSPSEIYDSGLKDRLLKQVIRLTYNWCDKIIAQTDYMKEDILKSYHVPAGKVITIRNIINTRFLDTESAYDRPAEFTEGQYKVVAAGALYSVKGFDLLIQAMTPLIEKDKTIRLYILGEERYEAGYKKYLQDLIDKNHMENYIYLLGYKSNPYPYLKNADLFVMSSRKEGFPNVVLEALYLKTPVVASNCVDFSRVIESGVNGYIVEKGNVLSLREGINRALSTTFDLDKLPIRNFDYNTLFV